MCDLFVYYNIYRTTFQEELYHEKQSEAKQQKALWWWMVTSETGKTSIFCHFIVSFLDLMINEDHQGIC